MQGRHFARLIGYDVAMRFQFSTRQILLATAFIAITCGGIVAYRKITGPFVREAALPWLVLGTHVALTSPLWVPGLFVAYGIAGRRALSTRVVVIFALVEVGAVFLSSQAARWIELLH